MSDEGEKGLKNKFQRIVKNDFLVLPDINGEELVHHKKVIIDFMLYPKPHLLEAGFDPVWFGVEVKHFGVVGETGKMSRFIWQSISYAQSTFQVDGTIVKPAFVLGFSDVYEVNPENDNLHRGYLSQLTGMLRLAGLAHVGTFHEILPSKNKPLGGWNIVFSSSSYFRRVDNEYKKTKYNIFKENVGNSAN
jgi:hypothetical protein